MSSEREISLIASALAAPAVTTERQTPDSDDFLALRRRAAAALGAQAVEIASRWETQARAAMPEREVTPDVRATFHASAVALVQSLATALATDGATSDDAVGLGLAFGTTAFASGVMLHHMLRAFDLLVAMCLFALEDDLAAADGRHAAATDGVRLCRRLQRASSLSTLAAARGYSLAANDATREQFRRLRHDMRNPLGTIQSAVSLMEDEAVPEEARRSPRFRAMIRRNARALDDMIVQRLGDAEARSPAGAYQRISLRAIVCAVRRDLRAEATAREVMLVVASRNTPYRLDAAGVELLMHDILLAAIQQADAGEVLTIDFGDEVEGRASIDLAAASGRAPIHATDTLHRLRAIGTRLGLWLEATDDRISLALPVMADEEAGGRPLHHPAGSRARDVGKPSDDLGSARQREDSETRAP